MNFEQNGSCDQKFLLLEQYSNFSKVYIINFISTLAMVSYGYFGDLMQRSERYRWLGPKRYDISGVRTFLGNYKNCSTITFQKLKWDMYRFRQ